MRTLLIILGVPIDALNMAQALDRLEEFIAIGRATGKCHQVATVNADFVVNALNDPELRRILQESDLATADGMPVVLASRLLGLPLEGRVAGADMVPELAARAAKRGYTMYLFGAGPGIAEQAAEVLKQRYPGLQIVGICSPKPSSVLEMDPSVLDDLRRTRPDILLVALGNPKQEKWISMHAPQLPVPVCIGVGGTFDLIAGVKRRAPRMMQHLGLEWLFRLLQEPGRLWRRYMIDFSYFGYFFVRQWWRMRQAPPPTPAPPVSRLALETEVGTLTIQGRLDAINQAEFMSYADTALTTSPWLVIDLSAATFLDSAALGALVGLAKRARDAGGGIVLAAIPTQIKDTLHLVRLDGFFETYTTVAEAKQNCRSRPEPFVEPTQEQDGWLVMKMPTSLDATTAPLMLTTAETKLVQCNRLILDCSETKFLSSAGMAAMVRLHRQATEQGGAVRIVGCTDDVLRTIKLVKLDQAIPIYATLPEALGYTDQSATVTI